MYENWKIFECHNSFCHYETPRKINSNSQANILIVIKLSTKDTEKKCVY